MAFLHRNRGLELPIHPPETVILNPSAAILAEHGQASFVRRARFSAPRCRSLKEALDSADKLFTAAAQSCGAVVVEHQWGVSERLPGEAVFRPTKLLPKGFLLVAEVETVTDIEPVSSEQQQAIRSGQMEAINRQG